MKEKQNKKSIIVIPDERIIGKIFYIRGKKVMFDRDLADLYGVETKVLNQAVKRNKKRFPEDFMFRLEKREADIFLRSQIVTLEMGKYSKYLPYVFTEQGVSMLSSVLKSERAIQVNIQIMRTFTRMRELLLTHKELREKIEKMERKYDGQFKVVFNVIKRLIKTDPEEKMGKIGFKDRQQTIKK